MIKELIGQGIQLLDKHLPNAEQKHELEMAEVSADKEIATAQSATNTTEAQNAHLFVSGWRPAIGWICAASLALYYIPKYMAGLVLWIEMCQRDNVLYQFPVNNDDILSLTFVLLGVGGLRTIEKFGRVARS